MCFLLYSSVKEYRSIWGEKMNLSFECFIWLQSKTNGAHEGQLLWGAENICQAWNTEWSLFTS